MRLYHTATIANGASQSNVIPLEGHVVLAVLLPAAWTAADLTILAADTEAGTYLPVYDAAGNEVTWQADTSRWVTVTREATEGFHWIKLRSGTAAAAVNQGAARTIKVALAPVG